LRNRARFPGQPDPGHKKLQLMNDHRSAISPESLPKPGEVALLTVINVVLDVPADELPGRVALVRHYVAAALDAVPGTRRTTFQVIAQLLAREANHVPRSAETTTPDLDHSEEPSGN
jgi:hypothetical protein